LAGEEPRIAGEPLRTFSHDRLVIALWAGRFVEPLDAGEESESDRGAQVGLGKRRNVACGYGRRRRLTAGLRPAAVAAGRRLVGCRPRLAAGRSPIGQNQRVILRSPSSWRSSRRAARRRTAVRDEPPTRDTRSFASLRMTTADVEQPIAVRTAASCQPAVRRRRRP
jgi:hypothetical protein